MLPCNIGTPASEQVVETKLKTWWKCHPEVRATVWLLLWYCISCYWQVRGTSPPILLNIFWFITIIRAVFVIEAIPRGRAARASPFFYAWLVQEELGTKEEQEPRVCDSRGVWG